MTYTGRTNPSARRYRRYAGLFATVLVAVGVAGAIGAQTPAPKLSILRQVDDGGPGAPSTVVRSADHAVWVSLEWASPLAGEAAYDIEWVGPDGKPILTASAKAKAGATSCATGIYIAGKPVASQPGSYKVRVRAQGQAAVAAEAVFELKRSEPDPNRPEVTGALAQSVDDKIAPVGATTRFSADSKAVWISLSSAKPIPAGHSIVAKVFGSDGKAVLVGKPLEYRDGADRLASGYLIAGRTWAQAGGDFRFRVMWDDDPTPLADLPFSIARANRYALLIGIKDYPPKGAEGDLPGCDLDVDSMHELLRDSFGMPEDHIVMLRDLDATKPAIERAFADLAARAGPQDAAIVYYSGHGGLVPDMNGDEDDGWDEAIVPAEPVPSLITTDTEMARLITDDRIAEMLRAFKTSNVTVVFDCCHAGTAVRDDEGEPPADMCVTRFRHFDYSRAIMRRAQEARRKASAQGSTVPPSTRAPEPAQAGDARPDDLSFGSRYVFVAASRPWETSGCNGAGGFLTRSLVQALRASNGRSWAQLIPGVSESVSEFRYGQNPSVEGAVRRLPFSLEEVREDGPYMRPFVAVVGAAEAKADEGSKAAIEADGKAGTHRALLEGYQNLYMEQVGALYDVYPKADTEFSGKPKARVRITGDRQPVIVAKPAGKPEVQKTYSTAEIVSGSVHVGDRLVAVAIPVPAARPRVGLYVSAKAPESEKSQLIDAAKAIYEKLKGLPTIQPLLEFKFSDTDYVIEPRMVEKQLSAFIWSSGGWRMASFSGTGAELTQKALGFILNRHRDVTRVVRLKNPSPAFGFQAEVLGGDRVVEPGSDVRIRLRSGAACRAVVIPASGDAVARPTVLSQSLKPVEPVTFTITIPKGARGYVPVKIIATTEQLGEADLGSGSPADGLISALRKRHGDGGAGGGFISANGWADATLMIAVGG